MRAWAEDIVDPERRRRTLRHIDNPFADAVPVPAPASAFAPASASAGAGLAGGSGEAVEMVDVEMVDVEMGGVVGGGLRTSVLGVVVGGVWLEETLVMLPVGVRGVGSVVVSVGGDGWFVMTHPVTGEVIESGWVVGASGAASVDWWEVGDVVPVEVGEGEREQVFDDVGLPVELLGSQCGGVAG